MVKGEQMKIGIIGQGFVGTAVREGLKNYHNNFQQKMRAVSKS